MSAEATSSAQPSTTPTESASLVPSAESVELVPTGGHPVHGLHVQVYSGIAGVPVRWRLLSGNHRDMGRGALDFPDEESCHIGIKEMVVALEQLVPSVVRATGNRWSWRLTLNGTVLATSGHTFDRRGRCEEACARFLQMLPGAEVRDGVSVLFSGGSSARAAGSIPGPRPGMGERWSAVHRPVTDQTSGSGLLGQERGRAAQTTAGGDPIA